MVNKTYDQAIATAKVHVDTRTQKAESIASSYDGLVGKFIIEWAKSFKDRALREKPEVAKGLGGKKLGEMKAAFNDLVSKYPDLASEALLKNVFWPHREGLPENLVSNTMAYYELQQRHKESVDEMLKQLIGHVGVILARYDFVETGRDSHWEVAGGGTLVYAYGVGGPGFKTGKPLDDTRKLYAEEIEELVRVEVALRNARHAKEAAEAKDLWDDA